MLDELAAPDLIVSAIPERLDRSDGFLALGWIASVARKQRHDRRPVSFLRITASWGGPDDDQQNIDRARQA